MEDRKKILIVDDEASVRESLSMLLEDSYNVIQAENGRKALSLLQESCVPDIVVLDLLMPEIDGLDTLKSIAQSYPNLPVIVLTASNTAKTAVQAMKLGAKDYLTKPFDVEELKSIIKANLNSRSARTENVSVNKVKRNVKGDFGPMIGKSKEIQDLFQKIQQIAPFKTTVLISGESGTGKELVARSIHQYSNRCDKPFVAINCSAIPETLIESELFGHEKGAFTHAVDSRIGYLEQADGGTLFLDEIGELSLAVQVKLLRFLQELEFQRVGSSTPISVDVRIIAATNRDLEEEVRKKRFREDLFYRINVVSLHLSPLRDRFEDIPHLIEHFVNIYSPVYGNNKIFFNKEALEALIQYNWPGNVRELENLVESMLALGLNGEVTEKDLPKKILNGGSAPAFLSTGDIVNKEIGFEEAEKQFETDIIIKALRKANFVQTKAAKILGISRRILKYKMDKLGIDIEELTKDMQ